MSVILLANESGKKIAGQKPLVMLIDEGKTGWETSMELGNMDLALLIAYKLKCNWKIDFHLIARISSPNDRQQAKNYLQSVVELARIPNVEIWVVNKGEENDLIGKIEPSVIISSFTGETTIDDMRSQSEQLDLPFLFTMDSGKENALS